MKARLVVVVSGLPATGKTTVGTMLGERLSLPLVDKDAILVNWWNHDSAPQRLRDIATSLVEVHCDCPVKLAAERFQARRRHPGHHDGQRSAEEIKDGITRLRDSYRGPLRVGELVRIDTSGPVDPDHATELVRTAMAAAVPAG